MMSTDRPIIETGDYWRRSWPEYETLRQADPPRGVVLRSGPRVPADAAERDG